MSPESSPEQELVESLRAERPRLGTSLPEAPPPTPSAAGTATSADAPASSAGTTAAGCVDPERAEKSVALLWGAIHNLPAAASPEKLGWLKMSDPVCREAARLLLAAFPELSAVDQYRAVAIIICLAGLLTIYTRQKNEWAAAHPPAAARPPAAEARLAA
ncbi:MAG: hypothetical protein ACRD2F_14120 [Terriglobales bacterium]